MSLLPNSYRALIIGSSGAIGSAFLELLKNSSSCSSVVGIHRNSDPSIDYENLTSIEIAANALISQGPFQLIINTVGILHSPLWLPEKKLSDLNSHQLEKMFQINSIGPAITIQLFSQLLDNQHSLMVTLSAKVGSIEDNRLGGWYSYRASKAALNMLIKTTAIELKRTKPNTALIAMHPGTVNSKLSKPFKGELIGRSPLEASQDMLRVIESLNIEDTGSFFSYSGEKIPW